MAIYFAGVGETQLITGDGMTTTVASAIDAGGYTNSAIQIDEENTLTEHIVYVDAPAGVLWCSFTYYGYRNFWSNTDRVVALKDTNGDPIVWCDATSGEDLVFYVNDGTTDTEIGRLVDGYNANNRVDFKVDMGVSGGGELYLNGNLVNSAAVNMSARTLDMASFSFRAIAAANSDYTRFGVFIIADEDTRGMTVQEARPTADGVVFTDFSGDYTALNNNGVNEGGAVQGVSAGDTQSYDVDNLHTDFSTGYEIVAVILNSRSSHGSGSALDQLAHIITDGTNTLEGGDIQLDTVAQPRFSIFTTAPDGSAWDETNFNAAEFGLRAKSSS